MRGDIYRLRLRDTYGHEQSGTRYAVVLQSDRLPLSSTIQIAPTSTSARPTDFRPRINMNGQTTYVMVEQARAVDPEKRLGDFAGRLDAAELAEVDRAIQLVFGTFGK